MKIVIIQPDHTNATYKIEHYEPGKIRINQQDYGCSVIIRPHHFHPFWPPNQFSELLSSHFDLLTEPLPSILLLGTGTKLIIPPQELLLPLFQKGIGVEFMDSKAACFTFTALAAEERDVAACILII